MTRIFKEYLLRTCWLCLVIGSIAVISRADERKLEVGIHLPLLRLSEHVGTDAGVGGRIGYALAPWFTLEGELGIFPKDRTRITRLCTPDSICLRAPTIPTSSDRRIQGLFGIKSGIRQERFGLFGKIRPGFIQLTNRVDVVCVAEPCPPLSSKSTEFALDLGGVLEVYPSGRWLLRFDVGDTYVSGTGIDLVPAAHKLGHNLQIGFGIGIRF